ncbi:hypothetical protein V1522DRAFT_269674 [Lipomyces starkeyi]
MSTIFRAIVWGVYVPKSRIFPIIMTLLYLFETVSAYEHGRLCVSAVYHLLDADPNGHGEFSTVVEESGLVVYQEGVDLNVMPFSLLLTDVTGSARVSTTFKVGIHVCTLHGRWDSLLAYPPLVPYISNITCGGTDRIWSITSSDARYRKSLQIGPNSGYYMDSYDLFGMYCGSY